jgi:hypothetical protein
MALVVQQQAAITKLGSVHRVTNLQSAASNHCPAFIPKSSAARQLANLSRSSFLTNPLNRSICRNPVTGRQGNKKRMAEAALGLFGPPSKGKVGEDLPEGYEHDDPSKHMPKRRAGILLHPTSLPGPYGVGELGEDAFKFIDWLKTTGCTVWQVPLRSRKSGCIHSWQMIWCTG